MRKKDAILEVEFAFKQGMNAGYTIRHDHKILDEEIATRNFMVDFIRGLYAKKRL